MKVIAILTRMYEYMRRTTRDRRSTARARHGTAVESRRRVDIRTFNPYTPNLRPFALKLPTPKFSYVKWCTLCLCDARGGRVDIVYLLFLADQNFQRSTIGYISNNWASC